MTSPAIIATTEPAVSEHPGRIIKTVAYYAAYIALGVTAAVLGPTLPGLAENTKTGLSEISFLFTAISLGYMIGSFQGGRFYDRLPGHTLMTISLFIMAAILALAPIVPALWLLMAILFILGMSQGALDVGGNTLLVWLHGHKVGPFMNGLHFFFGLGAFLSPIIIARVALLNGGITWAYWILALLILPPAIWLAFLPSPAIPATSKDGAAGQVNRPLVLLIVLFFFLYVGAEVSFGGWNFTYALKLNLANETNAAYLTSAFWGSFTLGRLVGIPISARFKPQTILAADIAGCLVSVGIIMLWPNSLVAAWIGTLGLGVAMAPVFPITLSLAEQRMSITGKVTGWFLVGSSLGGMFLPWLIGQLFEKIGPQTTMIILMVDLVISLGIFAALVSHSKANLNN